MRPRLLAVDHMDDFGSPSIWITCFNEATAVSRGSPAVQLTRRAGVMALQ